MVLAFVRKYKIMDLECRFDAAKVRAFYWYSEGIFLFLERIFSLAERAVMSKNQATETSLVGMVLEKIRAFVYKAVVTGFKNFVLVIFYVKKQPVHVFRPDHFVKFPCYQNQTD